MVLSVVSMLTLAATPAVHPGVMPTAEVAGYSVSRPMIDFYAKASNLRNRIEISPSGGTVQIGGNRLFVVPWEYVETSWRGTQVWVILLANVTATDFTIMYVYLANSPDPFYLRSYTYSDGKLRTYTFSGVQRVQKNIVHTQSIPMPDIQFPEESRARSKFAALGADLYLNGEAGSLVNGTDTLTIYPLFNQLFTASDAYNEVWILARDSQGNRWFSILYFTSSDPHHVIMTHTLRLDDLQSAPMRTLDAKWKQGRFTVKLAVESPIPDSIIKVDGFPFSTDPNGRVNLFLMAGGHRIGLEPVVYRNEDVRSSFKSWSDGNTDNPRDVEIRTDMTLVAAYENEFNLKVVSEVELRDVGGWYKNGTLVSVAVHPTYNAQNATRFTVASWSGDVSPSLENGTVLMDGPKALTITWNKQFLMAFKVEGVPDSSELALAVAGKSYPLKLGGSVELWVDSGSTFAFEISPSDFKVGQTKYIFSGWHSTTGPTTGSSAAIQPMVFIASYRALFETSITLQVTPTIRLSKEPFKITGTVTNVNEAVSVNVYYSTDGSRWQLVESIETDPKGDFVYEWSPPAEHALFIKAEWVGDLSHEGSSSNVTALLNVAFWS